MSYDDLDDECTMRGGGPTATHENSGSLGRIDQYELTQELGGGGFGTVFLARDTISCTAVAVKGLPPIVKNSKEELENIRSNFAMVGKLTHTNIAKMLVLHPSKSVEYACEDVRQKLRVAPLGRLQHSDSSTEQMGDFRYAWQYSGMVRQRVSERQRRLHTEGWKLEIRFR